MHHVSPCTLRDPLLASAFTISRPHVIEMSISRRDSLFRSLQTRELESVSQEPYSKARPGRRITRRKYWIAAISIHQCLLRLTQFFVLPSIVPASLSVLRTHNGCIAFNTSTIIPVKMHDDGHKPDRHVTFLEWTFKHLRISSFSCRKQPWIYVFLQRNVTSLWSLVMLRHF